MSKIEPLVSGIPIDSKTNELTTQTFGTKADIGTSSEWIKCALVRWMWSEYGEGGLTVSTVDWLPGEENKHFVHDTMDLLIEAHEDF